MQERCRYSKAVSLDAKFLMPNGYIVECCGAVLKIRQPPKVAPKFKSKFLCMVMQLLFPANTSAGSKVHIYSLLQNDLNLERTSSIFFYIKHG